MSEFLTVIMAFCGLDGNYHECRKEVTRCLVCVYPRIKPPKNCKELDDKWEVDNKKRCECEKEFQKKDPEKWSPRDESIQLDWRKRLHAKCGDGYCVLPGYGEYSSSFCNSKENPKQKTEPRTNQRLDECLQKWVQK